MQFTSAPGLQGELDLTMLVDGNITTLDCSVALSTTTKTCTAPGPVTIPANSRISFQVLSQPFSGGTAPAVDVLFGWRATTA